ncbi:tyrosine-protein phosphatase non-receptor type 1-like [Rhopilema esculentum]|uniref:tyrosine-protein phosphatase non-receptor type 1-like n=1 Tax=Rhopilema esculentum TaxID=499914 RepID=UPI0031E48347|eukprot:gene1753-16237_t
MFLVEEVQKLDRSARWNYTFQVLNLETRKVVENFTLKAARQPEHRNLNRYRDVLPYDHSRVELEAGNTNYINGNLVEVDEIGRKYILTQGPLPDTCGHFWQMAWEQNSGAVIMLNKVIEKNAVKCHPYWPMGEDEVIEYGDYTVKNLSERSESAYVVRDLQLEHTPSGKSRSIKQFHFMLWPDFGVPSTPETFLEFLYDIRDSGVFDPDVGPPVIHCSAGIGRSGTFCLVDTALLKAEQDGKPDLIDVKNLLLHLRRYRVGLVQTPEQLRFSYLAIIQGIARMYPEVFKFEEQETGASHKRKVEDDEPPPIPPRKPPRRFENVPTTAAEESEKQQKMVKNLQDGVVDESSEEDGSEEEVLDLSGSEEEESGEEEVVELYETDEEEDEISNEQVSGKEAGDEIKDNTLETYGTDDEETETFESSIPVPPVPLNKPLPPLPDEAKGSSSDHETEPESNAGEGTKATDSGCSKTEKLLPVFTEEDEEDSISKSKNTTEKQTLTSSELEIKQGSHARLNEGLHHGSKGGPNVGDHNEPESRPLREVSDSSKETSEDTSTVKEIPQASGSREEEDKAREERELRQRKRRDERNQQTTETIERIKRKMQEQKIAAARNVLFKKSLIALAITAGLLAGYYWLFG